ncbi:MAG TPA: ferrochelatase, partial [Chloroflexi bacterium]|nr:ferrochelatase [Chloroflexota bacterium]
MTESIAVLVMAYGGPNNLEEVEPYLLDVRGGRPLPQRAIEAIKRRYKQIGGGSPILENTQAQAEALQEALGDPFQVFIGMRHWHPYI